MLLILTLAAWLYCRHRKSRSGSYPIKILQTVPAGFKHIGQPKIERKLLAALAPELPLATIILLLEHIAIAKCKSPETFISRKKLIPCSLRPLEWIPNQSQPRTNCDRCHKHRRLLLRRISSHWIILADCFEIQIRC